MKLTGGQIVCESLLREGVEIVFGIPGGAILPLYQTLPEYPQLRHVLMRHEQGAAHAADGYARATGKVGVAFGTSGPGATNLVTGIATAQMDSVPTVFVTGQVGRDAIGKDAFQEMDITGVTLPITKQNYLVWHASEIAGVIKEAFYLANTGRPGPVLVDIPKDVFVEETEFDYPETIDLPSYVPAQAADALDVKEAARLIDEAKRPLILAGHGNVISRSYEELRELAEKSQIPVITTLLGISSFPDTHPLCIGMPGMHGMAYANIAIDEADLLIALGMRFDDRITGKLSRFAPNAKIIHVDIDPSEIHKNVRATVPLVGDLKTVLEQLIPEVKPSSHDLWIQKIAELKEAHPPMRAKKTGGLRPQYILRTLSEATEGQAVIVTGVGQHQMWAAQHCTFTKPNSLITSGGLGTMGFEVPAALGAQIGRPDSPVWSVAGDGGFQMTMSELATLVENKIPVKFALLNNNCLGMVSQWQDLFYDKSYVQTGYTRNPDFVKLAEAFGMFGTRVTQENEVLPAIKAAINEPGPALIDFVIPKEENVYPMIPAGGSVEEQMEEPE
ncbi:biosynthetic-type acetolactate synthase large subunit [SAR202 cluster bacterium AD-804-J14_MRT_500m]|nr:biosynthetic-type acetolactate synthase large subunit [SAR202 cluster bacterium AD-804-J14_MRT_500m]